MFVAARIDILSADIRSADDKRRHGTGWRTTLNENFDKRPMATENPAASAINAGCSLPSQEFAIGLDRDSVPFRGTDSRFTSLALSVRIAYCAC